MVNKSELEPRISIMTFDRVESAKIVGIPYTTLANWGEELGITPSVRDAGKRGVQALYGVNDLFKAALAKKQLEGGLSKKVARVTVGAISDLLSAAGVFTTGEEIGGLLATGKDLEYIPRKNWDDPAKFQKDVLEHRGFCWILDLKPVMDDFMAAMLPVLQQHEMDEFGFVLEGPAKLGVYRLTLRDGTKFEAETFEAVFGQVNAHLEAALSPKASALARAMKESAAHRNALSTAAVDDMEDMARFVGYANAQEFSEDIANVRKTLQEISAK
jgi:hypothetical protein